MKKCKNCGKDLLDNEECTCTYSFSWTNTNYNQFNNISIKEKKKNGLNIATAIIYPLIMLIVNFALFKNGSLDLIPFIISILSCIGSSIFTLLSGFYFIIIPLPIIFLFKFGNQKPELDTTKKVLYTVLAVILLIWPFILLAF